MMHNKRAGAVGRWTGSAGRVARVMGLFTSAAGLSMALASACAGIAPSQSTVDGGEDANDGAVASGSVLHPACDAYLDCLREVTPQAYPAALESLGPDAPCWSSESTAAKCEDSCVRSKALLQQMESGTLPAACGATGSDSGTPPPSSGTALYYTACLTKLAAGRVDRVLSFYTVVTTTPGASGGASKVTMELTPLKVGPGSGPPVSVSKSQTVGATYRFDNAPVSASGAYAAFLGAVKVPGAANPISGRDIDIENVTMPGKLASPRFCSRLAGRITMPTDIPLAGEENTCVYIPATEGAPPPALNPNQSDFAVPCPID